MKKSASGGERPAKPNIKNLGLSIASAFLRNAPLLIAGVLLLIFSTFLGKTFLYIGISLCIAYLLSCGFQIVFENTSRGSKFADSGGDTPENEQKNNKADRR